MRMPGASWSPMGRTKRFTMNLSEREAVMLRELAHDAGLDQADVLRADIRQKHEARFGRAAAPVSAGRNLK